MNKTKLRAYAKLIARRGLNVSKGQDVIVQTEVEQLEFVNMVVEELYKAGARKVFVDFYSLTLSKTHNKYRKLDDMIKIEDFELEKIKWRSKNLPCILFLDGEDPDGLVGIDQEKESIASGKRYPILKPFIDEMENKYQWCIAAVPGTMWAKKLYPSLSKKKAVELLWENILKCSRSYDGNPIKNWDNHNSDLKKRCDYLNSLHLKELRYKSSNGTDFKVGLISDALFMGGAETSLKNKVFNPNIPSEEIFTSPKKGVCEGVLYATKPLSYRGEVIDEFYIIFKDGKAIEAHAKKNEKLLNQMINEDEFACFLGEVALVPFNSPINNTNILFYNTLFDENACCHVALGHGFTNVIKDYEKYSLEELREKGINDSMIHVDFMIGSSDLSIVGIDENDNEHIIFKEGNWAF
ncbi:MAG: aminopeptidase [bacterium]|nr:aminopeptidase [bacterium]